MTNVPTAPHVGDPSSFPVVGSHLVFATGECGRGALLASCQASFSGSTQQLCSDYVLLRASHAHTVLLSTARKDIFAVFSVATCRAVWETTVDRLTSSAASQRLHTSELPVMPSCLHFQPSLNARFHSDISTEKKEKCCGLRINLFWTFWDRLYLSSQWDFFSGFSSSLVFSVLHCFARSTLRLCRLATEMHNQYMHFPTHYNLLRTSTEHWRISNKMKRIINTIC